MQALQVSIHTLEEMKEDEPKGHVEAPSFFFGPPGLYTLGALLYSHIDDKEGSNVAKYLDKVLEFARYYEPESPLQSKIEDEVLYGSAGYLYCLLLLRKHIGLRHHAEIDKVIAMVIEALMIAGVNDKTDYLEYHFPRKRKTPYMGAAHGTIGVIYMMLKALQVSPAL